MKLLTRQIRQALPPLYSQEANPDPPVVAKFFTPDASWTWYATEGGPIDRDGIVCGQSGQPAVDYLFFGYVDGTFPELGYFSLSALESACGPLGLPIERDLHWTPAPLSTVTKGR